MLDLVTLARPARLDKSEVDELAEVFEDRSPQELLRWAIDRFGLRLAISTSFQTDGMVLLDMAWRIDPGIRVVTVDSGRLHQETYDLMEEVRDRYGIQIEVFYPETAALQEFVQTNGINPFYRSTPLRRSCCDIRKVEPLKRALAESDAWISGQRREHSATRQGVRKLEIDRTCDGRLKLNPLADWSEDRVWDYVRANDVPYNALYDRGYTSIGCAPCTRPTEPGEDPRAGRWWWEQDTPKECGIHWNFEQAALVAQAAAQFDQLLAGERS
ncbi:MAG TPA: phosphoadenylyl-sulfate reductase [Thermomicrobiales bacterium]